MDKNHDSLDDHDKEVLQTLDDLESNVCPDVSIHHQYHRPHDEFMLLPPPSAKTNEQND